MMPHVRVRFSARILINISWLSGNGSIARSWQTADMYGSCILRLVDWHRRLSHQVLAIFPEPSSAVTHTSILFEDAQAPVWCHELAIIPTCGQFNAFLSPATASGYALTSAVNEVSRNRRSVGKQRHFNFQDVIT